jgi:hypothetical protein
VIIIIHERGCITPRLYPPATVARLTSLFELVISPGSIEVGVTTVMTTKSVK